VRADPDDPVVNLWMGAEIECPKNGVA
jgi:hypothetical protein